MSGLISERFNSQFIPVAARNQKTGSFRFRVIAGTSEVSRPRESEIQLAKLYRGIPRYERYFLEASGYSRLRLALAPRLRLRTVL